MTLSQLKTGNSGLIVKCPHCGTEFTPADAIDHEMRRQLEKEFDERARLMAEAARKQEGEKLQHRLRLLEEDRQAKALKLREMEMQALSLRKREMELEAREANAEVEMKKRILDAEKRLREEAERTARDKVVVEFRERELSMAREREALMTDLQRKIQEAAEKARNEEKLRTAELQKKLDDQNRLLLEMERRSMQGSMQLQGEVQELAIESYLKQSFPRDIIEEVSKGKRGADCMHIVVDDFGRHCGKVLYESKRTKHFSNEWIAKLKDDMRSTGADAAVIVTAVFPEGMTRFGERDGVWICSFAEFKALAFLFRSNLLRVGEALAAQDNRGEKVQMLYEYVTGKSFRQKLEAAFEAFSTMNEDLSREKALFNSQWAKREKSILRAMESMVSLYGDVRGIAGGAVQEISSLEIPQIELSAEGG